MKKDLILLKDVLDLCKANRWTYYNLSNESKKYFRKQYNFLAENKNLYISWSMQNTLKLKKILTSNAGDYVSKIKAMEYINYIL